MSDTFLHLVPTDPHWHPDEAAATAVVKIARGLFPLAADIPLSVLSEISEPHR